MIALPQPRRSLATDADRLDISAEIAPMMPPAATPKAAVAVVSAAVAVVAAAEPSATSVARSDTLPVTAHRPVEPIEVAAVDSVVTEAAAVVVVDRPATLAVDTVIFPATALKDRSATTAVRSAIFPATAQVSKIESATSASSQATSWLNAQAITTLPHRRQHT